MELSRRLHFKLFAQAMRDRGTARNERKIGWPIYDSGSEAYENTFRSVLNGETFNDLMGELRDNFGGVRALDIMGTGRVLEELNADRGVALSLTKGPTRQEFSEERGSGIRLKTGDVVLPATWEKIVRTGEFNLVFCRPKGAIALIPDKEVRRWVFERMLGTLEEGGILLTQVSEKDGGDKDFWEVVREKSSMHCFDSERLTLFLRKK